MNTDDDIPYKAAEDIAREEQLEDQLLALDIVQFAGATRVAGLGADGRVTYKLVVGVRKGLANVAAMALGAFLRQVEWAERENVALEVIVLQGRTRYSP